MPFRDIYGHERPLGILKTVLERDRIPQALLFHGMEGIGKRTTALAFAQALNCREGGTDACGRCPSCRKIAHGTHPDVSTLTAEGQYIRIRDIRALQEQMQFKPYEGRWRVFLVQEADRMNLEAANALLKTLEEPSANHGLILLTAHPDRLPRTVLSRCQQVRFHPLPRETVQRFLVEQHALEAPPAALLASCSGGSIARALNLRQGDFLEMRRALLERMASPALREPWQRLSFLGELGQERRSLAERLAVMRSCWRDALVVRETGTADLLIHRDCEAEIRTLADRRTGEEILNNIRLIDRAIAALDQNANKQLTLEVMMFRLAL